MMGKGKFEQSAAHKAPVITMGNLTPEALRSWEMGCKQYFLHRSVAAAEQVHKVAWNLHDTQIQDWYINNNERLNGLSFADFIAKVHDCWLPSNWAALTRQKMLSPIQGSCPFYEWVVEIQSQNSILCNMPSHLMEAAVKYHLEAHMHHDLALDYCSTEIAGEESLHRWVEKVRLREIAKQKEAVDAALCAANRPPECRLVSGQGTSQKSFRSKGTVDTNKPTSNTKFVQLPALTVEEQRLLQENEGCFKCR
ncbi:hypothetical protein BS17DRAFT_769643 [Gyrodon lividus]|nr:hypothetical protein BS17DRAFT_769643 [Gyrodon lividus]